MKNQTLRQGYKRIQIQSGRQEEIPESWHIAPLRDVIQSVKTGFASGERDENGIVQLRMNNISDSGTLAFDKFLRVPIPEDVKQYDLRKDDVLFNNTNSLDLIGKSAIIGDHPDYTFSNHITRIRTDTKKLVPYFLLLLFLKYKRQAIFRSICNTHVGQSGIGKSELTRLKIILPPVAEQQEIASILSKVDNLIQKTDEIIEQTKRLKKGLMQKLLTRGIGHTKFKRIKWRYGKEIEIPEEWKRSSLSEIGELNAGGTPSTFKKEYWENGTIPWVSSGEIRNNKIITSNEKITKLGLENSAAELFPKGTVLVAITGFGMTRGRSSMLEIDAATNQSVIGIIPKKDLIDGVFLWYALQKQYWTLRNFAQGTQQPGLNLEIVRSFSIVYPSDISEQQKIASILSAVDLRIKEERDYNHHLQNLKRGLMQKLLTGQIRVKV